MPNSRTVLVPASMDRAGVALLQARPDLRVLSYDPRLDPAAFHALLHDAVACALSLTPFGAPEAAAAPALQVVARIGVGFDRVDVPALTAAGLPLCVAGTANSRSVAEHAVFFIFALAKRAADMDRYVRSGRAHERLSGLPGEIHGKTVLVVGFGRIGTRTAPRCQALGMEVLVHDPFVADEAIRTAGFEPTPDLDAALARADFVTIHCPKNAQTVGLFGAERLARMKPGAFLVNTARGGIVDEMALADAITRGHLGGAGLDVFDPEPPDAAHPLLQLDTVLASPHMAGVTVEANAAMAVVTAQNMLGVLDGTPLVENIVNPEAMRPQP